MAKCTLNSGRRRFQSYPARIGAIKVIDKDPSRLSLELGFVYQLYEGAIRK